MRRDKNTGKKLAIGAIMAGIGGYLAGILTAPKSGEETREDIANKATDFKNDARVELENLQDDLGDLLARAKEKTVDLSAHARKGFDEAVLRARDATDKSKEVLKAVKAGESEDPQLNKAVKQARQAKSNLSKYLKQ